MLEKFIEQFLPLIISICEIMGILVVTITSFRAFWQYIKSLLPKHENETNVKFELANGLATALEFKMAAEILKTVLVRELNELIVLGAIILLRALLSFLIHAEMKREEI